MRDVGAGSSLPIRVKLGATISLGQRGEFRPRAAARELGRCHAHCGQVASEPCIICQQRIFSPGIPEMSISGRSAPCGFRRSQAHLGSHKEHNGSAIVLVCFGG